MCDGTLLMYGMLHFCCLTALHMSGCKHTVFAMYHVFVAGVVVLGYHARGR
jgi:hypothetical protein